MPNRFAMYAAAALSVMAAWTQAASLVLTYTDVQVADDAAFTTNVTTVPIGANNLIVPLPGQYVRVGLAAAVADNPNTPGAIATGLALGVPQPANLGLAAFAMGMINSTPGGVVPSVNNVGKSTALINLKFNSTASAGVVDTATGNVGAGPPANTIYGGVNAGSVEAGDASETPRLSIGASTTRTDNVLFNRLTYQYTGPQQVTLTPNLLLAPNNGFAFVVPVTPGSAGPDVAFPTYGLRYYNASTDTVVGPGPLYVGIPEPVSLSAVCVGGAALLARRRKP